MKALLEYIFYQQLKISPREVKGIMVTHPAGNPNFNAYKMAELLFEHFEA